MNPLQASKTSFHDEAAVKAFLRSEKLNPLDYHKLVRSFYRKRLPWTTVLTFFTPEQAERFNQSFAPRSLELRVVNPSPDGTALKAVFASSEGLLIESVIIKHTSGRNTLCVSSQIGCPMDCVFCATGRLGLRRNLTAFEILEQVDWAIETLKAEDKTLRNIVFMGMGEPLLNPLELHRALDILMDQSKYPVAPSHLSISTCGIEPGILPLARKYPLVKLAVSLHAPNETLRQKLMPLVRSWPLDKLLPTLDQHAEITGQKTFFEYIMIKGVNDSPQLARELVELLKSRAHRAHVNLIPYNPGDVAGGQEEPWEASERPTLDHFQQVLREIGVPSTVRHSAGEAIAAACGQLAAGEKRNHKRGQVPLATT